MSERMTCRWKNRACRMSETAEGLRVPMRDHVSALMASAGRLGENVDVISAALPYNCDLIVERAVGRRCHRHRLVVVARSVPSQ